MPKNLITPAQIEAYQRDGYLVVPRFLQTAEVERLHRIAVGDERVNQHAIDLMDTAGKRTRLTLSYTPGNDPYGNLTRSSRMVHNVDLLLEGTAPVCHFHSKLMQKEPRVGGAWEWHQDYGYWYKNHFLYPNQMMSVMIAITEATPENGCLQVIKGSHKMGRVEHGFSGEQVGASPTYVDLALASMEHVYVALQPGDTLFFRSNLLHRSEANTSDQPRWSLISCYNRASNPPFNEPSGTSTIPLEVLPDEAVLTWSTREQLDASGFLQKENDQALK